MDRRVVREDGARAVPVVQVQIDDQDRLAESGAPDVVDRDRDVIEGAETGAAVPGRVMQATTKIDRHVAPFQGTVGRQQRAATDQALEGKERILCRGREGKSENGLHHLPVPLHDPVRILRHDPPDQLVDLPRKGSSVPFTDPVSR